MWLRCYRLSALCSKQFRRISVSCSLFLKVSFVLMEEKDLIGEPERKKMKLANESSSFCVLPLKPCHEIIQRNHEVDKVYSEMQRLKTSQPTSLTAVVLSGCSGCRKTELARQIGERFFSEKASEYDFVFTIDASSVNSILQLHVDLANLLPCDKPSIGKICDLDKTYSFMTEVDKVPLLQALIGTGINENSSWLLIVDDARPDAECIFSDTGGWLKVGDQLKHGKGQVLITTALTSTEFLNCQDSHMIEVSLSDGISPSESVQILKQISGLPNNEDIITQVAKALDFQPLALVGTALGLKDTPQTDGTNLWKTCLEDIEKAKQVEETEQETTKITVNAVNKAVTKLACKDEINKRTLQLLSFMSPSPLPLEYAVNYVKNMVEGKDETEIKNAILSCPLVLGRHEVIGVHYLVYSCLQQASDIRDTDTPSESESNPIKVFSPVNHLDVLCKLTMKSFPSLAEFDGSKDLDSTRPLTVHIDYILTQINTLICDYPVLMDLPVDEEHNILALLSLLSKFCYAHPMALARLKIFNICRRFKDHYSDKVDATNEVIVLKRLGDIYLNLDVQYKAQECLEEALEIEEAQAGIEHRNLIPILSKLAKLYFEEEQPDEAQEHFERLIKIQQATLDEKDPATADTLCELGELHKCVAEHNEAISCFEKALEIYRMAYHENHPKIAQTMGSLSFNFFHLEKYEEARVCAEQKLKILENSPESEQSTVVKSLDNLGNIMRVLGKYDQAQQHFKRSMELKSKMPGNDQTEYAESLTNLGNITADLGKYEEGKKYLEEALKIRQNIGEDDASVAMTMVCLGSVHLMLNNYADAKDYFEQTLTIQDNIYPRNHPEKAKTLCMLGDVLYDMGDMDEAKKTLKRGIKMTQELNGSDATLATLQSNLSKVFIKQGKYLRAEDCLKKALQIEESIYDSKHPTLAITLVNLAIVCDKLGKLQEAKQHCEKAFEIQESAFGESHPKLVNTLNTLGMIMRRLSHYKEAQKCFERALEIHNTMPASTALPSRTVNNLGLVLIDLGQYKQAKEKIEKALEIVKSKQGEKHPETAKVLGNLGTVLTHLEEYKEALKVYETQLEIIQESSTHGENHPDTVTPLNNISCVERHLGDLEKSKMSAERAMEIAQKTFQEEHPLVATVNETLGLVYTELTQYNKAKDCLQKALTTRQSILGEKHPLTAMSLGNLAYAHVVCKEYEEAKPLLQRSLEIDEENFGENHPSTADSLAALANVLRNLSQYEEARTYAERAVKINKQVYGDKHPSLVEVLRNLGLTLKKLDKHAEAQQVLDEADSIKKTEKNLSS